MRRIAACVLTGGIFGAGMARADVITTLQLPFNSVALYGTPRLTFTNEIAYVN